MKGRHRNISGAGDLNGFFAAYLAETVEDTIRPYVRVWALRGEQYAEVSIHAHAGYAFIDVIHSLKRGAGHASAVLDRICALADRYGVSLELIPQPLGFDGLDRRQLIAWYARRGFVPRYDDHLVRPPRGSA